jgi:hypothetical protein
MRFAEVWTGQEVRPIRWVDSQWIIVEMLFLPTKDLRPVSVDDLRELLPVLDSGPAGWPFLASEVELMKQQRGKGHDVQALQQVAHEMTMLARQCYPAMARGRRSAGQIESWMAAQRVREANEAEKGRRVANEEKARLQRVQRSAQTLTEQANKEKRDDCTCGLCFLLVLLFWAVFSTCAVLFVMATCAVITWTLPLVSLTN